VLLYDAEEPAGAKQNRILDVSALVAAGLEARHPRVICRAGPLARRVEELLVGGATSPMRSCAG
jgi:hypothetical protein